MKFKSILNEFVAALFLAAAWFFAFRIADLLTVFKTYSSIWFLPAGATMAIVMVAPGWLKLVPLLANISLALPQVRQAIGVHVVNDFEPLIHGIRLYAIYGGAGYFLVRVAKISMPFRRWTEIEWFVGTALVAASLATVTGIGLHLVAGNMTNAEALSQAEVWWLGDALGAIMVPPMLVPAIMLAMRRSLPDWNWPSPGSFGMQAMVIAVVSLSGALGPSLGMNLWYLVFPPVLIFALRGGIEQAATSILLTCVITPAVAMVFTNAAEVGNLTALLLTTAIAALLVGAATTERQQTAERLEALVAQRTEELEKAYELQRHLVRSLGHDLRQPVEAINLTVAALGEHSDMAARRTALVRVRQLGAMTSELLTRILTYARLDTGDVEAELAPLPLAQLIERLRATYIPQAEQRSQRLIWPETKLIVISDRDLLFQILSNHLDNAIRLTPEGGTVEVQIEPQDAGIGIFVTDGFDPSAPHQSSRAGLGLRIVSQAAQLLGAKMVDEQNRKGIILPPKR